MNKRGFTLLEMIFAIVVIIIAFYSLAQVFIAVLPKNAKVESLSMSVYLCNKVIEEKMAAPFGSISSVSSTQYAAPFNNYYYSITVTYVTTSDPDAVSANPTNYKKVSVRTWGGTSLSSVEIVTLVATSG